VVSGDFSAQRQTTRVKAQRTPVRLTPTKAFQPATGHMLWKFSVYLKLLSSVFLNLSFLLEQQYRQQKNPPSFTTPPSLDTASWLAAKLFPPDF
jgi:hypothetical protein